LEQLKAQSAEKLPSYLINIGITSLLLPASRFSLDTCDFEGVGQYSADSSKRMKERK
jgi:hypothetical protein